jgi:hypothetical protein
MKKISFRSGLIAAMLVIALGYASCSDDFDYDYDSSSDQYSGFRSSEDSTVYNPLVGDSVQQYAGLVISRIYFTGSGQTVRDQYFKISNISNDTIDAQGVVVLESKFVSTIAYYGFVTDTITNTPDPIDSLNFVTQVIYQIPNPTPIAPGDSVVLAYQIADLSPSGINLSGADYAWEGTTETGPFLTKIFSYSATVWVLHNRGFCSYAIAALPDGLETDTTKLNYRGWKYTATYYLNVGTTPYSFKASNAYKIPKEWIIDAVNVQAPVYSSNVLHTLPHSLDYGYTYAGDTTNNNATTRYGYAVTRKDSAGIFIDTNNSTNDFIPNDFLSTPY